MSAQLACGLSGYGIDEGEPVGIQFLVEGFQPKRHMDSMIFSGRVSQDSSFPDYRPYFPPVYATLDEYYRIKKVKPSHTVDVLEDLLQISVKTAFNIIVNGVDPYGRRSETIEAYSGNKEAIKQTDSLTPEALEALGFIPVSGAKHPTYMYEGYRFEQRDDEQWTYVNTKIKFGEPKSYELGSYLNHAFIRFVSREKVYPGYPVKYHKSIARLLTLSAMLFHPTVFEYLKTTDEDIRLAQPSPWGSIRTRRSYFDEHWDEVMNMDEEAQDRYDRHGMVPINFEDHFLNRYSGLRGAGREAIAAVISYGKEGADELWEMRNIVEFTQNSGRILQPSQVIDETGNEDEMKAIATAVKELKKRRRARWE